MPQPETVNELSELVLDEISLVDSPANPGAEVMLFKRHDPETEKVLRKFDERSLEEIMGDQERQRKWWNLMDAFQQKQHSINEDKDLDEAAKQAALATAANDLADSIKRLIGGKDMPKEKKEPEVTVESLQAQVEELTGQLKTATTSVETLTAEKAELEKKLKPEEPKEDPLEKADPVIKAELAKLRAESEANKAAAEEAQALAKAEKDKRELAEFTKQAEETYPSLPGEPSAKGALLKRISTLEEGERGTLEKMLKSGEEAMAMQLAERGRSGIPLGSAQEKLDSRVAELIEKGTVKTRALAIEHLYKIKDPVLKEARQ